MLTLHRMIGKEEETLDHPHCPQNSPYCVEVEEGKTYAWCTCGLSLTQPFCDGQHKGTGFRSHKWVAPKTEKVFLCGCKRTGKEPFCDGSHSL
ncbi:MAG: CDGSH iron-sulfur domain-containing protein [Alphaproteobacteria bacterium]